MPRGKWILAKINHLIWIHQMCLRPWPRRCIWPPEALVFLPGILALLLMALLVYVDATATAVVIHVG